MDIYQESLKMAMTAEGAKTILLKFLSRSHPGRANGKSLTTMMINVALLRAIESLDKEIKEGEENDKN